MGFRLDDATKDVLSLRTSLSRAAPLEGWARFEFIMPPSNLMAVNHPTSKLLKYAAPGVRTSPWRNILTRP